MKNDPPSNFSLIETFLLERGEYFLRDLHMERLLASAKHFVRPVDKRKILTDLHHLSSTLDLSIRSRVRLVLDDKGHTEITSVPFEYLSPGPVKVAFSDKKTDPADIFLYHKTTNRALYDAASVEARDRGLFDLIFTNLEGEVTEGAITNVMIKTGKDYFTPPILCGLLPGVYRAYLLESGDLAVKEKVLFKEDLLKADAVFVMNSVRKLLPATLIG